MFKCKEFRRYDVTASASEVVVDDGTGAVVGHPPTMFKVQELDRSGVCLRTKLTPDPAKLLNDWIAENS